MTPSLYDRVRKNGAALLIFSFSLFLFYLLYRLRSLDDSRLTSWEDVFAVVQPLHTAVFLCAGLFMAFIVSRFGLIERMPSVILFTVSLMVSAIFSQEPEMIVDASRYFTQAKHLELYGVWYFFQEWGSGINAWTDLPAIPFFYGMLFSLFGESRYVIQVFNALLFSLSVVLTYQTGKELWNRDTGLFAALFLLGIPYLFTQVPLMLVDVPSMFFLMLSIYTFLLALRRGRVMVSIASLAIFIAFFTKYSAWLMLSIIPVIYAVELYQYRRERLDRTALRGMIVFFVSFFLISIVIAFKHDEIVKQIHLLITYQKPGLARWGESLVSTYFFQMHPVIPVLAVASLFAAFRKRDSSYIIIAWLVFLVLALQIRRIRYIIMVFPLLCLMASYGLVLIRDKMHARFLAYSAAAFSLTLAISAFLPFLQHTSAANLRDAAGYLDNLDVERVQVFTPLPQDYVMNPAVSVPLLDLYTKKNLVYRYEDAEYPPPEDLSSSALRFTWAYINPRYYQQGAKEDDKKAALIITDQGKGGLPLSLLQEINALPEKRTFERGDNAFRHQTVVTIYH